MSKPCLEWRGLVFNNCEILNPVDKTLVKSVDWWYVKCHCGNIFKAHPNDMKKGHTISCKCIMKANTKKMGKANKKEYYNGYTNQYGVKILRPVEENKNTIKDKWFLSCPRCFKEFIGQPYKAVEGSIRSCKCLRKNKARRFLIEIHNKNRINQGFKRGQLITPKKLLIRRMIFNPVRKLILELDNYCCCLCLKTFNKMYVHHIVPIRDNFNLVKLNSYKHIYDINNLITMCKKCHIDLAHDGHASKLNLSIQKELTEIISMRVVTPEILTIYNNIVSTKIIPWINKFK